MIWPPSRLDRFPANLAGSGQSQPQPSNMGPVWYDDCTEELRWGIFVNDQDSCCWCGTVFWICYRDSNKQVYFLKKNKQLHLKLLLKERCVCRTSGRIWFNLPTVVQRYVTRFIALIGILVCARWCLGKRKWTERFQTNTHLQISLEISVWRCQANGYCVLHFHKELLPRHQRYWHQRYCSADCIVNIIIADCDHVSVSGKGSTAHVSVRNAFFNSFLHFDFQKSCLIFFTKKRFAVCFSCVREVTVVKTTYFRRWCITRNRLSSRQNLSLSLSNPVLSSYANGR